MIREQFGTDHRIFDDETQTVIIKDFHGKVLEVRRYTPEEIREAEEILASAEAAEQNAQQTESIESSIEHIKRIRQNTLRDMQVAESLRQEAEALSAHIGGLAEGEDVDLREVLRNQQKIISAMADMYAHRRRNDEATATVYQSILYIAESLTKQ